MKKNEEYIVEIIDNGFNGEGIAKVDNLAIFIHGTIKGEKVKIKILKVTSSHAYGKVIDILEKSGHRKESDCDTYTRCGGCDLRHIDYSEILRMKENSVKNTLKKTLGKDVRVQPCIGMDNPYFYRNKLQYPVGMDKNKRVVMGVFAERTHEIVLTRYCMIQDELSQKIVNDTYEFIIKNNFKVYDESLQKGSIRHIIIRAGKSTNEVMIVLVSNEEKIQLERELVEFLTGKYKEIKTIVKNINSKNTNVILGNKNEVLFGDGYIYDYLGDYRFKISPMSFYQVNPIQTEKLYNKAIEYAELTGQEVVFDLYCGIGTIGIFASKNVSKLYGIEVVEEAIQDAKENAKINSIENAEFFAGNVEEVLPKLIKEKNIKPDVIFLDPSRRGCEKSALDTILEVEPKKIVYVSCNPATLARDLQTLSEKYDIKHVQPVDMFCFSKHVECVVMLTLKRSKKC